MEKRHCVDNQPNLLTLPELVLREILDNLGGPEFIALRAVCKATRSWVNAEPFYIKQIPLQIRNNHVLDQVLQSHDYTSSRIEWSNLVFHQRYYAENGGSVALIRKFGPFLKSVTIGTLVVNTLYSGTRELIDNFLIELEASAPRLESLKILGQFHLPTFAQGIIVGPIADPLEKQRSQLQGLKFPGLRRLEVIPHFPLQADWIWPLLDLLLKACPNLDWIALPTMAGVRQTALHEYGMDNPLVEYLKRLAEKPAIPQQPQPRRRKFHLDFCSNRDQLDSVVNREHIGHLLPLFRFDLRTLIELSSLAAQLRGKLYNVPVQALRSIEPFIQADSPPNTLSDVHSALGSLVCRNVKTGTGNLDLPMPLNSAAEIFVSLEIDQSVDYAQFELPEDKNVVQISVFSPPSWEGLPGAGKTVLLQSLFQTVRPTVTTLRMKNAIPLYSSVPGTTEAYNLSEYFPNLRKLCLFEMTGVEPGDFLTMTMGISNLSTTLEELFLEKCRMTDSCLFESGKTRTTVFDSFVLRKLKNLTAVTIIRCEIIRRTSQGERWGRSRTESALKALKLKTSVFRDNKDEFI